MNEINMTIHNGVRSYRQYWGGRQVIALNPPQIVEPFYVQNITNSNETLSIVKSNSYAPDITIEKSSDGINWSTFGTTSTTALTQTLQPGEKLYLRASANTWGNAASPTSTVTYYNRIRGVSRVGGDIMSLIYGGNFTGQETSFPAGSTNNFDSIFYNATTLLDASQLILPATTLTRKCYQRMFAGCTALITAPSILPATIIADSCYLQMFSYCTSLTTAPSILPATTLARACYEYMFEGCTALTNAPELPATTLTDSCYYRMFADCTSLITAPELPATVLTDYCYENMFSGCTSLTTAPSILPATTLTDGCYSSMFSGCTSLTTAPELPATTLDAECYLGMFGGCTSLAYIKCLATDINWVDCTYRWVNGVAASGTFIKNANMSDWTTGTDGIPSGWTVQDA